MISARLLVLRCFTYTSMIRSAAALYVLRALATPLRRAQIAYISSACRRAVRRYEDTRAERSPAASRISINTSFGAGSSVTPVIFVSAAARVGGMHTAMTARTIVIRVMLIA